ncbi:MAG: hypothetical protein Q7K34_04560 [archaeon]|nr:hypothetical protein [archaeon]
MGNMTLAVEDKIQKRMERHTEIKWSQVARDAFEEKLNELEWMDDLLKNSKLEEKDAEEIGEHIKSKIWSRFKKRFAK